MKFIRNWFAPDNAIGFEERSLRLILAVLMVVDIFMLFLSVVVYKDEIKPVGYFSVTVTTNLLVLLAVWLVTRGYIRQSAALVVALPVFGTAALLYVSRLESSTSGMINNIVAMIVAVIVATFILPGIIRFWLPP